MFETKSNQFVLETMNKNFATVLAFSEMSESERMEARKGARPVDAAFVNLIFFLKAFEEAKERGLLTPAELEIGETWKMLVAGN